MHFWMELQKHALETCTFGGFRENKIYVANKWEIVNENQK